jgi:uncharacterized protein Veg
MINNIKEDLNKKLNSTCEIIINERRSKKIKCIGKVIKLYSNIFIINIDGKNISFSYSDVLTKKIILK